MFKSGKGPGLLAALTLAITALTACGGDSGSANELRLWHYESPDSAMGMAWADAIKEFEASHPGVKVVFEEKGFEQIQKTAPMVLNSDDAPDVLEYNKGNATTGLLSTQGLLTDMSDEVAKRGWDKLLSPSLRITCQYDDRGVMGSGKWYGVPNYAEYVLVYYNKDLFTKHGVAVPRTLDELTSAMDAFVRAGVTPLAVGGREYPAQQILYQLALTKADRGWVDNFQRYTGPVDFHDQAWTYAATTFVDWVNKGYISKNSVSVDAENMGTEFISGKAPIMISGSWWYGRIRDDIRDFEWDSFLWPGTLTAGSSGNLWVVPEGSKNKELAYDFIEITMRKRAQSVLGNSGGVPVVGDTEITDATSKKLIENFTTLTNGDRLAYYPDWPAAGYYDVLVSATQKLINGTSTPHQALDEIAKPYQEHLTTIGE
jgi:raffinose/stachyose/melibiose transport system substrate-binding protein